jgi:hypothetical protein
MCLMAYRTLAGIRIAPRERATSALTSRPVNNDHSTRTPASARRHLPHPRPGF